MIIQNGLFAVKFIGNNRDFGAGVVVIREGSVNGGDSGYFYQGQFDYYEQEARAVIQVSHHSGPVNSVMGPLRSFTLNVAGRITETGFDMVGGIQSMPGVNIRIQGRWIAELV
jgi:hypothetical protein